MSAERTPAEPGGPERTARVTGQDWLRERARIERERIQLARTILQLAAVEPQRRLALSPDEAAASLGVSRDYFDAHVLPELSVVRRGRRRLIAVRELERWLEESAARALER